MFNPDTRYKRTFTVSSFDVDAKKQASLQSVARYMQEMATQHAINMKLGFDDMIRENRAWVLAQMLIRIDRFPRFMDDFSITTWSNGPDGRFALRDFIIEDAAGEKIGGASTTWFVIDIDEKKICRLDGYFPGYDYTHIEFALGRKPDRVKVDPSANDEEHTRVRFSELDINGHMNNVRYLDYIIDMIPNNFRMQNNLIEIEMNFLKESKLDQRLRAGIVQGHHDKEFLHYIFNEDEGRTSFSARSVWH